MTAFTTADIPPAINTIEKLAYWAGSVIINANPTLAVKEDENRVERVAIPYEFIDQDGNTRIAIRISFRIDPLYASQTAAKKWTFIQEFVNTAIPTAFKTN